MLVTEHLRQSAAVFEEMAATVGVRPKYVRDRNWANLLQNATFSALLERARALHMAAEIVAKSEIPDATA